MSYRIGRGYIDTGGGDSREVAAYRLMTAIRDKCPEVLAEFVSDVRYPATTVGYRTLPDEPGRPRVRVVTVVPSPELSAWAKRKHLNCRAIYKWATQTVEEWERHPESRDGLQWELPQGRFGRDWSGQTSENRDDPLAPVGAMPFDEFPENFEARAKTHWDARVKELERQGYDPAPVKKTLSHFEWFARFQCRDESLGSIAKDVGLKVKSIHDAVVSTAKLVGLKRRPAGKGGRPRKPSNQKP